MRYQSILLYNSVFCLMSGIGLQISNYTFVNDIGPDISIGFNYYRYHGYGFTFHYDTFNYILKLFQDDPNDIGYGFIVNLIMLSFSLYLFSSYNQIKKGKFKIMDAVQS